LEKTEIVDIGEISFVDD